MIAQDAPPPLTPWDWFGFCVAVVWAVLLWVAVYRMLCSCQTPPARWSYVAAVWTVVLVPIVILKAAGTW